MNRCWIAALLLLLITLTACRPGDTGNAAPSPTDEAPTVIPSPTVSPPADNDTTAVPEAPTAGPPTALPAEPATIEAPEPTATATAVPQLGPAPANWDALAEWLSYAWAANINPGQVRAGLRAVGWQQDEADWHGADLDGDLRDEWLLTLYTLPDDPNYVELASGRSGDLWIVNDSGLVYRASDAGLDAFSAAPLVFGIADMTGDGRPDVVTQTTMCGAHTCFQDYRVLSTHSGALRNIVLDQDGNRGTINISYSEAQLTDSTGDGLVDLVVHGGLIGSAGAGIQRAHTEVWQWQERGIRRASLHYDASEFRFHWLYDANDAFAADDNENARFLYGEVVGNEELKDVEWADPADEIKAATRQFAAFRLALLSLQADNTAQARQWRDWLTAEYPETPLAQAAVTLLDEYSRNLNLAAACQTITTDLLLLDRPTGPLEYMGYANPALTAEDVCPID